ncbi:MAG: hypothetical protein HYY17_05435 [Planctomycetes bacterium]|nr:hypothetical protein [Planctomycetota bacterium]
MRDDINLLNLTNGMNYSVHQLAHLALYAKKAEETRKQGDEERVYDVETALKYRSALAEVLAVLERGGDPKVEAVRAALRLRAQLAQGKRKPGAKGRKDPGAELAALAASTKEILFPNQRQVLVDYSPCLIPPKDLKDPVRVGQAHDSGPAIRILTTLRSIPDKRWQEKKDDIADRTLARMEEAEGKFPEGEREAKKRALLDIVERARAMSDVDFELQKEDLAKEFEQFARKEILKKELEETIGSDAVLEGKVRAIVLHSRAAGIYEARLKQLKESTAGKPVDLDKISPADHCKNGGCAIKER